jgi:Spx/MgsR family transcriptional regulator
VTKNASFYHWAKCSTCRDARKAIAAAGTSVDERDFFKDPLTREEIMRIAALSSLDEMFSWKSPSAEPYRERRGKMSDSELITLMLAEPRLIRRPVLITGGSVLFGFRAREYEQALKKAR